MEFGNNYLVCKPICMFIWTQWQLIYWETGMPRNTMRRAARSHDLNSEAWEMWQIQMANINTWFKYLYQHKYVTSCITAMTDCPTMHFSALQHSAIWCMGVWQSVNTASNGNVLHCRTRVDIWRDRCDRWSCKILVSHVNFQKISGTAQQFTKS